jgi:uncharacterized iron-regulated membrane protein
LWIRRRGTAIPLVLKGAETLKPILLAKQNLHILARILRHAEDLGLLLCFLCLLMVETGYLAWLEHLPVAPARTTGDLNNGFLQIPTWYIHPTVEARLLLTVFGGTLCWAGLSLVSFLRTRGRNTVTAQTQRATVKARLRNTAFWAFVAGTQLLWMQFIGS